MTSKAARTAALAAASQTNVVVRAGLFVQANNADGTVVVDFGAGGVTCFNSGVFQPLPGDSVRCIQIGATTIMLGRTAPKGATGTITAVTSPVASVLLSDGTTQQMPYLASYTPVVGNVVLIDWPAGGIILGAVTQLPSGVYVPPPAEAPTSAVKTTVTQFKARDSGNYYQIGGSWASGDDVWCSDNNLGCWFYGATPGNTIPDSAAILNVRAFMVEFYNEFPTSHATVGLHTLGTKSGTPVISSAISISAGSGWKDLPNSFGDALKTGSKRGLGTNHGGYHKFRGRSDDSRSGLLEITWRI